MQTSYQQQALVGATGMELVIALYDGAIRFLYRAVQCVEEGDVRGRRLAVNRALDVLMYLQARLRPDLAGSTAQSLSDFYAAMFTMALEASHHESIEQFQEVIACLRNVRDAWTIASRDPEAGKVLPRELRTREERFVAPPPPTTNGKINERLALVRIACAITNAIHCLCWMTLFVRCRPTEITMRRSLSSFVAMLCLLTLFVSSAACMALPQDALAATTTQHEHMMNAPEHACCPQSSPAGEHLSTTCCTVHHQPVSAAAAVEIEQPAVITDALQVPVLVAAALYPPSGRTIIRPQQPPSVPLRI